MKSKKKQRLLALILSMVLMLSASISAMAEGEGQTEASGTENMGEQVSAQNLDEETTGGDEEITPTETEEVDSQSLNTPEVPVQEYKEQETTGEGTPVQGETNGEPVQEVTEEPATETTEISSQSEEQQTEEETEEDIDDTEETVSESAELKQEFTDENGNVTQTITAYVPEGAFQARADQMSMEVNFLNTDETDYIKGMMEDLLPENHYLDGYVFYQIDFKVDGEITQPAKAITISMDGNELEVEDTEKAHVFYYDPADPEVAGDKDELLDIIQKDQLINYLTESGQGTENIEDYDYSEIAVNDGNADTITLKGWESTIYGCYVENVSEEKTFTEKVGNVTVKVTAPEGAFPMDAEDVTMTAESLTDEQREAVEEQLQAQAEAQGQELKDYIAFDINLWADDEKIQPQIPVTVSFEKAGLDTEEADSTLGFQLDEESRKVDEIEGEVQENGKVEVKAEHFTPTGYAAFGSSLEENEFSTLESKATESLAASLSASGESEEQIVREPYYKEDGSTEEPYFPDNNTDVRIQKNIAPTDEENEFYIYLNVEPQLSWKEIFSMTGLWLVNSNKNTPLSIEGKIDENTTASEVQKIIKGGGGSNAPVSKVTDEESISNENNYTKWDKKGPINVKYVIVDADGNRDEYVIKDQYYSVPANSDSITVLARLPFQQYYSLTTANWDYSTGKRTLCVEILEESLFEGTGKFVLRDDKIDLDTVTDPMGDFIIYEDNNAVSNNATSDFSSRKQTITWEFPENKNLPVDFQDYEIVTLPDGTETVYWKNAYEMVYKVKLNTEAKGFDFNEIYDTNKETVLKYKTEDTSKEAKFKIPAVKAKIKDFIFQKVNQEGTPLSGAEFALYEEKDTEFEKPIATATSGTDGKVQFVLDDGKFLNPGTYIMKETKVPDQCVQADTTWQYIVKGDGTAELRDENGSLISKPGDNEYPQIVNYEIAGHINTEKTASVIDWDNRTYKIELYASHDLSVEWPKDIVLALDVSGSMAWTLSPPSSKTMKLEDIKIKGNSYVTNDKELIDQSAIVSNYKEFHYYAQSGSDYKPIVYTGSKWWYVAANGDGDIATDGQVPDQENTTVYVVEKQRSVQIKLEALQEAVKAFVENVKNISPESKIGIVTFSGDVKYSKELAPAGTYTEESWDNIFKQITLSGGTAQNAGLDKAYSLIKNSEYQNKAVVLFTDGAPNIDKNIPMAEQVATVNQAANQVKEIADLFTVGLYDEKTAEEQTEYMQQWASSPSDKYCFITSDTESLMKEFADLFASMNIAVTGATMKDYIDPRFVVTGSDGEPLEDGSAVGDGGILRTDSNGVQYVEWTNQTISYSKDGTTGWNQTIFIKAKPEYVGGNDVTTNTGSGYTVTVNGLTVSESSPIVNVKIDFNIGEAEDTIFLGESLEEYFTEAKQTSVTNIKPTTGADKYTNWSDVVVPVTIQWFTDQECSKPVTVDAIKAMKPEKDTVYYAKVTIVPITYGEQGKANTGGHTNSSEGVSQIGTYKVEVVSGSLVIKKVIDQAPEDIPDNGLTFRFKIYNKIAGENIQLEDPVEIKFTKEELSQNDLVHEKTIPNMPQGIYVVEEESTELYECTKIEYTGKAPNPVAIKDSSIYMGLLDDGTSDVTNGTHLSRRDGEAEVTNQYVPQKKVIDLQKYGTDTSTGQIEGAIFSMYKGDLENENFTWSEMSEYKNIEVSEEDTEEVELAYGYYKLVEEQAPIGYQLLNKDILFKVDKDGVHLVNEAGEEIDSAPDNMWELGADSLVIKIKNKALYSLPSAGGPGIFLYMIGGTLLLIAGSLMIYINRRRGVLRR